MTNWFDNPVYIINEAARKKILEEIFSKFSPEEQQLIEKMAIRFSELLKEADKEK